MGWNSSFSWAWPELIPGHWEGLLGLVTSLGSSLDARHSPWAFEQLGKAPGPWPDLGLTLWHSQNTLSHTPFRIPGLTLKVLFLVILGLFELCTFFAVLAHFSQIGTFGTFCSFGNLWPHIGHQNVTGPPGALSFDVKPEIAQEKSL